MKGIHRGTTEGVTIKYACYSKTIIITTYVSSTIDYRMHKRPRLQVECRMDKKQPWRLELSSLDVGHYAAGRREAVRCWTLQINSW